MLSAILKTLFPQKVYLFAEVVRELMTHILEKPFLAFGDFEIADDMKQLIVDEMNKYSEIFQ